MISKQQIIDLYDVNQLIDCEKIGKIIEEKKEKKIIFFGAGIAAEILMDKLGDQHVIECFIDNNDKLWGSEIKGVEIKSVKCLLEMKRGEFFVFVLNRFKYESEEQLINMGFEKKIDFDDIYNEFNPIVRTIKYIDLVYKFAKFIERIPANIFDNIERHKKKSIGVVCSGTLTYSQTWYPIAIFLLLKSQGFKVSLIMENIYSFEDITYFSNQYSVVKIYTDFIVELMKTRFGDLDVRYIDPQFQLELDKDDYREIEREVKYNLLWQNARFFDMPYVPMEGREEKFRESFVYNLKVLKAFFSENKFDSINVLTGLHKNKGLYTWLGVKYGMEVSNYDGASGESDTMTSVNYPNGYHYDILKIVKEDMLDEKSKKYIVDIAKQTFEDRLRATVSNAGYNFQLTSKVDKNQEYYDIIIPLNINCDAAAMGIDRVFYDEREWLFETLDYIVQKTEASVMIREHPAMNLPNWLPYNIKRYGEEIRLKYGDNKRVYFCDAEKKINTYRMIEQCKVVLPYTSTIGVESVLMEKKVIIHTNVYYATTDFVYNASNKQEYFDFIKKAILNRLEEKKYDKNEPYIMFYALLNSTIRTAFLEFRNEWMDWPFEELLKAEGVDLLIKVFGDGIPAPLLNFNKIIEKKHLS